MKTQTRWKIGCCYFLRTVTYHMVGRVVAVDGPFIYMEDAAWIADSGRLADFIAGRIPPNEAEPVGDWFLNESSVVDGCVWTHPLITSQI